LHFPVVSLDAGLLDINGTLIAEIIAFLLMLGVLARWVYPPIIRAAEARQLQIKQQLEQAEKARQEAEARLRAAQDEIQKARLQAGQIIEQANRAAERIQQEAQEKAREEARRIVEAASRDIDAERQRAIQSIRLQMAGIVTEAVRRIVGENLDDERHRQLIEATIEQVEKAPSASQ
jgi:F-type H+-transporting ATPase subunit b